MPSPVSAHTERALTAIRVWLALAPLAIAPPGAEPRGEVRRASPCSAVAARARRSQSAVTRLQSLALAGAAALFEVTRPWTVERSNRVAGWASSMAGPAVGAVLL